MAQQESSGGGPCWDNLPSIIMLEIFSYLPHQDRLRASVVCKNWRQALFHPSFWKKITFSLKYYDGIEWSRHLAECFALSVQDATVRCWTPHRTSEFEKLLRRFRGNRNLRKLILEPTCSCLEEPVSLPVTGLQVAEGWVYPILDSVVKIIKTSKRLEVLTLGCIEDLTACSGDVISALCESKQERNLTHLGLASVKDNPEDYKRASIDPLSLRNFVSLTILTIDYDNLSDSLLGALSCGMLRRLVVHVHNWDKNLPGTSNAAWQRFCQKNPECSLRLSLLHAYTAVKVLDTEILRPAMPLTHLKALFCECVNRKALLRLSNWYTESLMSIVWIDSMDAKELIPPTLDFSFHDSNPGNNNSTDNVADVDYSPDPFVLIAWKCTHFIELIYMGHKYYQDDMLAIARLRSGMLQGFEVAESDLLYDDYNFQKTQEELRDYLGQDWRPLADHELPTVITDAIKGDSRDVIMPRVLQDAK